MIPVLTQLERARRVPELAVLSAMARGHTEHSVAIAKAAFAALAALSEVDAERATIYHDVIDLHLNAAAKTALEEMMEAKWEYQSNFAKKYIGIGRAEGKAEGELAGEARGKAEGRVEKQRQTLAKLIKLRLGEPDASTLARLGTAGEDELDLWTERILTAETLSELFA